MKSIKIIFYDSPCPFCNRFVNFVIERDCRNELYCAGLDSNLAKEKGFYNIDPDTMIFLENGSVSTKSTAALNILTCLGGIYRAAGLFKLVPRCVRDVVYDLVARCRRRLWSGPKSCQVPSPRMQERRLD